MPQSVRPELVEGLPFLCAAIEEERQGFDKLSPNGYFASGLLMFTRTFTAEPADIDELGHVNNAVWVRWVQDIGVAHWNAAATPEQVAAYFWVIVRHEIDYLGNIAEGETVEVRTWVGDAPKGAKFDRHVEFVKDDKAIVRAKTTWAIIDRASGRILRVPKDVVERFA